MANHKDQTAEEIHGEVTDIIERCDESVRQCREQLLNYILRLTECEQAIFDKYDIKSHEISGNMKDREEIEQKIKDLSIIVNNYKEPTDRDNFSWTERDNFKAYKNRWIPILRRILEYNFNEKEIRRWYDNIRCHEWVRVTDDFDEKSIERLEALEWVLGIPEGNAEKHYDEPLIPNEDLSNPLLNMRRKVYDELSWTKNRMIKMHNTSIEMLDKLTTDVNEMEERTFKSLGKLNPESDSYCWKKGFADSFGALVKGLQRLTIGLY